MNKLIPFVLILLLACEGLIAQDLSESYDLAIGVKIYPGAISVKKSIGENKYVEGLGSFWNKGFRATGLYEWHADLGNLSGLKWYYGAGAHLGFYDQSHYRGQTMIGLDGALGIDYKIKNTPLDLSVDWQPSFEFGGGAGFQGWGGFSVRICL